MFSESAYLSVRMSVLLLSAEATAEQESAEQSETPAEELAEPKEPEQVCAGF